MQLRTKRAAALKADKCIYRMIRGGTNQNYEQARDEYIQENNFLVANLFIEPKIMKDIKSAYMRDVQFIFGCYRKVHQT